MFKEFFDSRIKLPLVFSVVFSILFILSSFKIIPTSHTGMRITLGIVNDNVLSSGFYLKIPFIQSIKVVSNRQHQESDTLSLAQTSDLQPVSVDYGVLYRIPENKVLANFKEVKGDVFNLIIVPRLNESIRDALAKLPAEELIKNRDSIRSYIKTRLQERVNSFAEIDDVVIKGFVFQDKNWQDAINRKVIAKQDAETAFNLKEKAKNEADAKVIEAKGQAESIRITTQALSQQQQSLNYVKLKWIEKWNGQLPKVSSSSGTLLNFDSLN